MHEGIGRNSIGDVPLEMERNGVVCECYGTEEPFGGHGHMARAALYIVFEADWIKCGCFRP